MPMAAVGPWVGVWNMVLGLGPWDGLVLRFFLGIWSLGWVVFGWPNAGR